MWYNLWLYSQNYLATMFSKVIQFGYIMKLSKALIESAMQNHITKNIYLDSKYIIHLQQGSKPALSNFFETNTASVTNKRLLTIKKG